MLELEIDELTKEGIGDHIELWQSYYDSAKGEDQWQCQKAMAVVEVNTAVQTYREGDRQTIRGRVHFSAAEFTEEDLVGNPHVKVGDNIYPVSQQYLVVREQQYTIDSINEVIGGMISVNVVRVDSRHTNPSFIDPI